MVANGKGEQAESKQQIIKIQNNTESSKLKLLYIKI